MARELLKILLLIVRNSMKLYVGVKNASDVRVGNLLVAQRIQACRVYFKM